MIGNQYADNTTLCPNYSSDDRREALADPGLDIVPARRTNGYHSPRLAEARFTPGTVLANRYRVVDALGRGGMGEVYRAEDLKLGGFVALKFLPESVAADEHKLAALLEEARVARQVAHANVCRVFDVGVHVAEDATEFHFISMEHVEGEDLRTLLQRIGRLPKSKALEISQELCQGLDAVHSMGLVHCDIKPGNIMIDGAGRVRLTDFGLATAILEQGSKSQGGTPAYMAPEQHTGRAATVRSDLYALGLVLYEIFTGHRVFLAQSPYEYAWLHMESRPESLSSKVPDVDPEVERIILKCLEKRPERRPASVDALALDLAKVNPEGSTTPSKLAEGETLCTLLICDLVDSTYLLEELGDRHAMELWRKHDRLARELLAAHDGREIDKTDGFLFLFERPLQALQFAVAYHDGLRTLSEQIDRKVTARVGIHFGEVWLRENSSDDVSRGAKPLEVDGLAKTMTGRLMAFARSGHTLLSRAAFDLARRAAVGLEDASDLRWLDHGSWRLKGMADPIDIFEVGREGLAPLSPPKESETVRCLLIQPRVAGWRPAPGLAIPQRRNWQVERRLGGGGFGEVWLARHSKTGDLRGFKFCFDVERLQALKREITLFRLLKEELGERDDINRIIDWNLEEAPYFIESEYTRAGSLPDWIDDAGGLGAIPLDARVEIVAQVAMALAAAHSIGVLHKDVKPSNVLIQPSGDGVQAQLADFGIGQITERERLAEAGITVLGMSEPTLEPTSSVAGGTRIYMAPELLENRPPTLQADIYALGVMLYQLIVGDLRRAIAPGWRRDVDDVVLAEDISYFVDRSPDRRPASAHEVAQRLRTLNERRREHQAKLEAQQALEISQRRRRIYKAVAVTSVIALVVVSVFATWAVYAGQKEKKAREATDDILAFIIDTFEMADPAKNRGEAITAQELLDRGTERLKEEFEEEPLVRARLMTTFGNIYISLGVYGKAKPLLEEALEVERYLAGEGREAACSLTNLAVMFRKAGDLENAKALHKQALKIRQRILGIEHPNTLSSMDNLAIVLGELGDYSGAKQLLEQTLEIQQRVLGIEHPKTQTTMSNFAAALYLIGDFSRAKQLYEQVIEIFRKTLAAEHPHTLASMNNLALVLGDLGDHSRAKRIQGQSLEIYQRNLGTDHPGTLLTMANLANTLRELGDLAAAEQMHVQTLEMRQRILGAEHPHTLTSLTNLAATAYALGDLVEARHIQEQTLEMWLRIQGDEHPETLVSMYDFANTLRDLGELSRAKELHEQALETRQRVLGKEHPHTMKSMKDLATTLKALGDHARADQLQKLAAELEA